MYGVRCALNNVYNLIITKYFEIMENIIKDLRNALYILLAVVLYIVCIPLTIIQAIAFGLQYMITSDYLFDKYNPLSGEVASRVVQHYR